MKFETRSHERTRREMMKERESRIEWDRSERKTGKRQNGGEESRNETKGSRDLRRQERRRGERKICKEKFKSRG